MNLITVKAQPMEAYKFAGGYENDVLISESETAIIRLHRDVTLTSAFTLLTGGGIFD